MDRKFIGIRRRLSSRHTQTIVQLVIASVLSFALIYISIKYVYPSVSNYMIPTTRPTTTTTTKATTTIRKTTIKQAFDIGCFFHQTNITLVDGSTRSLDSLNIGDKVLVYHPSGQLHSSTILTIFHHQRSSVRLLDIYTINQHEPLRLTPFHSILTRKSTSKQSTFHYDFALNIAIGDFVLSSNFQSLKVTNIKEIILYNQTISTPLTFEGNIIVNNLIASCYATYQHKFMHLLTIPIRYWYQLGNFPRLNHFLIDLIEFYSKINFFNLS
ncbi:hypothetical protein I4U23_017614 [Adineta vaga]|nr:hypothetical protein I4U23_017614 [Adineta vaga]